MTIDAAIMTAVWDTLQVTASVLLFAAIGVSLYFKIDEYTPGERIGMGIVAAGCIMRVGPVVGKPSPYDEWASLWMIIGMVILVLGRHFRHAYANWVASREAERILKQKGLLK